MATLKERRDADKKRVTAWRDRQAKEGKKNVSITISKEAYEVLMMEKKRTGESNSAIVERALLALVESPAES